MMKNLSTGRSLSSAIAAFALTVGTACSDSVGPLDAQNVELAGGPVSSANPLNGVFFFIDAQSNARRWTPAWEMARFGRHFRATCREWKSRYRPAIRSNPFC